MSAIRSILRCYLRYFDFSGRASRSEYTWFTVFIAVVIGGSMLAIEVMDDWAMRGYDQLTQEEQFAFHVTRMESIWPRPGVVFVMLGLILVPGYAVAVRRGHDAGINGFSAVMMYMSGLGIFRLMFLPTWPMENEYGPVPPEVEIADFEDIPED